MDPLNQRVARRAASSATRTGEDSNTSTEREQLSKFLRSQVAKVEALHQQQLNVQSGEHSSRHLVAKRVAARFIESREEAPNDPNVTGWRVACPDGHVRHNPYHNEGDAIDHAKMASDPEWFADRGCRLAPKPGRLERACPPCPGGKHWVVPILAEHRRWNN
jgi:hypothetical protein